MAHDPTYNLLHTRVRYDLDGLNSEASGWIAAEDADSFDVDWGTVFRIRARISESAGNGSNVTLKWQVNRESAGWVDVRLGTSATATSPVIAVPSPVLFDDGDTINTEFLTSGGGTFVNGEGDENSAISTSIDSEETEVETAFMFMFSYDGPAFNADEDSFEFRLVENDGTVFGGTDNTVTITLNTVDYYLGGTFAESPSKCFWVDDDGNAYALIETAESTPSLMIMKSEDGGRTWEEQDSGNGPTEVDMESIAGRLANNRIYIAHQNQGHEVFHHIFVVSTDGSSPDTWETIDESVQAGVALNANPQSVAIERRSDGDKILFYIRDNGSQDHAYYKIDTGGGWGGENTLDDEASHHCKGITTVMGEDDLIHIFYTMQETGVAGTLYHDSLDSGDSLSGRQEVDANVGTGNDDRWVMTSAIYWDDSGNEKIMVVYKDSDDLLYSVVVTNDGSPESRKAASDNTASADPGSTGSNQVTADLVVDGSDAYLHYANAADLDLYKTENPNNGSWITDVEELNNKTIHWIRSQAFTHNAGNGGDTVVGYIYDNGSDGGTGYIWYGELVIAAAPTTLPFVERTILQAVNRASTY